MSTTFARYGTAKYGTDRYGQQNVTVDAVDVSGTSRLGIPSVEIVEIGTSVNKKVNGVAGVGVAQHVNINATVFDFNSVKDNYERRRTVFVNRKSTASERIVKVA